MGNFRSNNRGGFGGRSGGSRFNSDRNRFGEGRGFGRRERGPPEMHDATCSKCGKRCQVPFKPTGSKPVLCSDCFRQNDGSQSNFSSRNQEIKSGASSEQLNQINKKLDKILAVLQELEIDVGDDEDEYSDDDLEEDEEDLEEDDNDLNSDSDEDLDDDSDESSEEDSEDKSENV